MRRLTIALCGVLVATAHAGNFYITDGATTTNSTGIVDANGDYSPYGLLDSLSVFSSYGLLDILGASSTWGILDNSGNSAGFGILDFDGYAHPPGIFTFDYSYLYQGAIGSLQCGVTGMVDTNGTYQQRGIIDDTDHAQTAGLWDGTYWMARGILDATNGAHADGTFDGSLWHDLSYAHTLAGGTLSAVNIGTLTGTDNLSPTNLLSGVTVDDVVGALTFPANKPGFGGGAFSQ